jgi:hypothetical protein
VGQRDRPDHFQKHWRVAGVAGDPMCHERAQQVGECNGYFDYINSSYISLTFEADGIEPDFADQDIYQDFDEFIEAHNE